MGLVKILLVVITVAASIVTSVFSFRDHPWLPTALYPFGRHALHQIVVAACFGETHPRHLAGSQSLVCAVVATITLGYWVYEVLAEGWWGHRLRNEYIAALTSQDECVVNATGYPMSAEFEQCPCEPCQEKICADDTSTGGGGGGEVCVDELCYCLQAVLLWSSAGILAVYQFAYAMMYTVLSSTGSNSSSGKTQLFLGLLIPGAVIAWVSALIGGSSIGAASVVEGLLMSFTVHTLMLIFLVVGSKQVHEAVMSVALIRKFAGVMDGPYADWGRAIFMLLLVWFFVPFGVVACVNQTMRKIGLGRPLKEDERMLFFTEAYADVIHHMATDWQYSSILHKAIVLGVAYFVLAIGVAKASIVCMAWMNEQLESASLGLVVLAYIGSGLTMFLNPACPAQPVYLTGGILVVNSAERMFAECTATSEMLGDLKSGAVVEYNGVNVTAATCTPSGDPESSTMLCFCPDLHEKGWWKAIALAAWVTFALKLCAIFLEQVLIGHNLGNLLYVRRTVQVNSVEVRAFRVLLEVPGLNWKKVVILCGGPDWPVSVLTGILRLSVIQMLLGSTPFILLNTPTVMAGAFQLRTSESDMWSVLAVAMFVVAGLVQFSATMTCFLVVAETSEARAEELAAMPDDEEVKAAEAQAAFEAQQWRELTQWKDMPVFCKALLVLGWLCMAVFCFMAFFLGGECWAAVDVGTPIGAPPLNADTLGVAIRRIVKPTGVVVLAFYAAGIVLMLVYNNWAKRHVKANAHKFVDDSRAATESEPTAEVDQDDGTENPLGPDFNAVEVHEV